MTAASWAGAAVLCWHLSFVGGLPKEVPADQVRPYVTGDQRLRVICFQDANTIYLRPQSDAALEDQASGARLAVINTGALVTVRASRGRLHVTTSGYRAAGERILLRPLDANAGTIVSARRGSGRRGQYPGGLEIIAGASGLLLVEHVNLEDYVAGVVAAEVPRKFPLEAMKAQAIAARTYALFHLGDHSYRGGDLCSEIHCQAYRGVPRSDSRAAAAALQTRGQVLTYNGILADAMYHADCGGATATAWDVRQGKLLPYLSGTEDRAPSRHPDRPYCARDRDTTWEKRFSWRQAERLVASNLGAVLGDARISAGGLKSLRVVAQGDFGRVKWLKVSTTSGDHLVLGDAVRWLFGTGRAGPGGLPSTRFSLAVAAGADGRPRAVVFRGKGRGHGIGLCQWGARGRADAGQTATEILSAYYPRAEVLDLSKEIRD